MIKYLSLFTGIAGFELGIQQAYEYQKAIRSKIRPSDKVGSVLSNGNSSDNNTSYGSRWRPRPICIGYSEIDKYACQIYEKHFKHKNYGDITKINVKELPEFDFLVGGFPCQSFSIAGKRKGFDDTRGTLFFDIARILAHKKPRCILLENVKGLLSHDGGKTFQTILGVLSDLGYFVEWQVLNSKNFGVPQNRERVFIIGYLGGEPRPKVFPIGETTKRTVKTKKLSEPISNCLRTNYSNGHSNETYIKRLKTPSFDRFPIKENGKEISRTLLARDYKDPKLVRDVKRIGGLYDKEKETHQAGSIYDPSGISGTLDTGQGGNRQPFIQSNPHGFNKGGKREIPNVRESAIQNEFVNGIRKLTPIECERLQGFPNNWTYKGIQSGEFVNISDTQRYKTLGNAVTVNVVKELILKLFYND